MFSNWQDNNKANAPEGRIFLFLLQYDNDLVLNLADSSVINLLSWNKEKSESFNQWPIMNNRDFKYLSVLHAWRNLFFFESLLFWFICSRIRPGRPGPNHHVTHQNTQQNCDVKSTPSLWNSGNSFNSKFHQNLKKIQYSLGFIPQWFTLLLD